MFTGSIGATLTSPPGRDWQANRMPGPIATRASTAASPVTVPE